MSNFSYNTDSAGILNAEGKVLDREKFITVIILIIKNMCPQIGQTYLTDTTPDQLTEVVPEVKPDGEILIKLRILITYYKIVAVVAHENNKKILKVKSFGAM